MNYYDDQNHNLDLLIREMQRGGPICECPEEAGECICGRRDVKEQFERAPIDIVRSVLQDALTSTGLKLNRTAKLKRNSLGQLILPFGKYNGKIFDDVPLSYLDETISVMPATWLVTMAKEYVAMCMGILFNGSLGHIKIVPRHSWNAILNGNDGELSSFVAFRERD